MTKKNKRQGPKREFDLVRSGQFRILAMFLLLPQDGQYVIKEELLWLILLIHHHPARIDWNAFKTNLYGPPPLMQATWWEISDVRKIEKAICPPLRSALCTLSKYWECIISQRNYPTLNIQHSLITREVLILPRSLLIGQYKCVYFQQVWHGSQIVEKQMAKTIEGPSTPAI